MAIAEGVTIPVVIGAAIIDSINPCAFGVLIFILGYLLKVSKSKTKVLLDGFGYVVGVYFTYLFLGALIFMGINQVNETLQQAAITLPILGEVQLTAFFYQIIGVIIIFFGLLELKDFVAPGKGPSLQIMPGWAEKIKQWTKTLGNMAGRNFWFGFGFSVVMGFLVALVELPCTGAPYIAVITILTRAGLTLTESMPLLAAYNVVFVLPLLGIMFIVYRGMGVQQLKAWKDDHKIMMRVATGVLLIALGLAIFFFDVFFGG